MDYKKSELRLGNFFQDQQKNLLSVCDLSTEEVTTIAFKVVDRSRFPLPDGWKAEPIPISREWLMKLGFNVHLNRYWFEQDDEFKSNFAVIWDEKASLFKVPFIGFWYEIKTIHQLQNLFFALTGKELKIHD